MNPETRRWLVLWAGALFGYGLLMFVNPARPSLRDGFRCLCRHRQLWWVPALFGVFHAAFSLWVRVYEAWVIPDAPPALLPWTGWQPPGWGDALTASLLPAAEGTSSLFNCVATTFPLSALWAGLLLCNWRGYQAVLYRALRRRGGRAASVCVHAALLLCAVAALCKPILFGGLPRLNAYLGEAALLRLGEAVNALSFFFEYLLGVAVQIYLVLLVFTWTRGLSFNFDGLRRFALRRFSFVARWAAVVLIVSALGISLPLIVASFRPLEAPWETTGFVRATRWGLTVLLVAFCSVQLLLIFHNETLRQAWADALSLWRRYAWHVASFLAVGAVHFLALAMVNAYLPPALGQWTWPGAAWNVLVYPTLWGGLAGWFLASWVCLFRRCERGCPDAAGLVRF